MPANYFSSVTVICKDSALADSLSTALFCMNYEDGKSLVKSMQGVDVVWIRSDGEMYVTDGIESLLAK
jgi:thiamine biosynthesis lipoprotein